MNSKEYRHNDIGETSGEDVGGAREEAERQDENSWIYVSRKDASRGGENRQRYRRWKMKIK